MFAVAPSKHFERSLRAELYNDVTRAVLRTSACSFGRKLCHVLLLFY